MNLESAFRVTQMGQFGLSGSILEWDEETLTQAKKAITEYKSILPLIRQAEVYHLTPQVNVEDPHSFQAAQYFDPESGESLVFAFRDNDPMAHFKVVPRRIDSSKQYVLKSQQLRWEAKGKDLVNGFELDLPTTGSSTLVRITPL